MIFLRRFLVVALVALAAGLAALPLGHSPWADQFRDRVARYEASRPRATITRSTTPLPPPPRRGFARPYLKPWAPLVFLGGIPFGLTLAALAFARRRTRRLGSL